MPVDQFSPAAKDLGVRVAQLVKDGAVTFGWLRAELPGHRGTRCLEAAPNAVLCDGISDLLDEALRYALHAGLIHWESNDRAVGIHMVGGDAEGPTTQEVRRHQGPHWLPVFLRPGPNPLGAQPCPS